jgi:hypothetical protein
MGHRDGIPEDPNEFKAWSSNFVTQIEKNYRILNIPKEEVEILKTYFLAIDPDVLCEEPPPSEPSPVNGYTIYWDEERRFLQMFCECWGVPFKEEDGSFDAMLLHKNITADPAKDSMDNWREYIVKQARKTAETYNMPPAWVEGIQERLQKSKRSSQKKKHGKKEIENARNLFLMFYRP